VSQAAAQTDPQQGSTDEVVALAARCARPACRREFQREVSRGRPQVYCSETCRGVADKEYRAARGVVTHYEDALNLARVDLAAFGRDTEKSEARVLTAADQADALERARRVAEHARGAAEYAAAGDPRLRDVLQELVAAIAPVLGTTAR
jgi:hypothetical protein